MSVSTHPHIVVVGGGLAGLAAATFAARAGLKTLLLERAAQPGGRAQTTRTEEGFLLNQGPHALYRGGFAWSILERLGVPFTGRAATGAGSLALVGDTLHTLPVGFLSLATTSLLGRGDKLALVRFLRELPRLDAESLDDVTLGAWLDRALPRPAVRAFAEMLARVASYAHARDLLAAGTAVRQMQLAVTRGVWYLDGGWGTLVDGARRAAEAAGVTVRTSAQVSRVVVEDGAATGVVVGDEIIDAGAVILAVPPRTAASLLASPTLDEVVRTAVPLRAACLDLGLAALPRPRARVAFAIDRPLYLSVHSSVARLAPGETALLHAARYLAPDEDPGDVEAELEAWVERIQPGWRDEVVVRRFLPRLTVVHAAPQPGGRGRAQVALPDVDGVFLAGDWVGDQGHLLDCSLASAERAAALAQSVLPRERLREIA